MEPEEPLFPPSVRPAIPVDAQAICALLRQADLQPRDVLAAGTRFWVAEDRERALVGCLGLEVGEQAVLVRSVAVRPDRRKQGLAESLVQAALGWAAGQGKQYAYLFSVRAGGYWQRLGFREVPVQELVEALPQAHQVRHFAQIGKLPTEHAWRMTIGPPSA